MKRFKFSVNNKFKIYMSYQIYPILVIILSYLIISYLELKINFLKFTFEGRILFSAVLLVMSIVILNLHATLMKEINDSEE